MDSNYKTVEDFKSLVIKEGNDFSFVKLGDVAKIEIGPEETRQLFRKWRRNDRSGYFKATEANLIKVTNGVKVEFEKIKNELPKTLKFIKVMIPLFCLRGF